MKPSEYRRSTLSVDAAGIPDDLSAAIVAKAAKAGLGDILGDALAAVLTTSVRERRRFGRTKVAEHRCAALVTPQWLVWATDEGDGAPVVVSAHLSTIDLADYATTSMADLVADSGLEVTVPVAGSATSGFGGLFLGLGPEPAAGAFTDALAEATRAAGGVVRLS